MKRFATGALCLVIAGWAWGNAQAQVTMQLDYEGHLWGYSQNMQVAYNSTWKDVGGMGRLECTTLGAPEPGGDGTYFDFFCVDVGTYISSAPWAVTRWEVPPMIPPVPPHNLLDAAYVYQTYRDLGAGQGWMNNADHSAAVQLALWEITHEVDWRTSSRSDWYADGIFQARKSYGTALPAAIVDYATSILQGNALFTDTYTLSESIFYYGRGISVSQGLIGHGNPVPPVPEPSTLAMLGIALISAAGLVWKRARK